MKRLGTGTSLDRCPYRSHEVDPKDNGTDLALFRAEVLAERQAQWLGTVLLAPRPSTRLWTLFAALAAAAVLVLLWLGDFTRTARVGGVLMPAEGMVRVFAPRPGVVTALHAGEGAEVRKGEPLLTLSAELRSTALGATQAEIVRRLGERRRNLIEERRRQEALLAQQEKAIGERLNTLRAEDAQLGREIGLLDSRVAIAARVEGLNRKLAGQGFISELRLQQVESETLEQRARTGALQRGRVVLQRERLALEGELRDLPLKSRKEVAALERDISALEQELAAAESQREIVVPAPHDGTVTAVLAELGGQASVTAPLLSIVPARAKLEAHLYGPSRAVGFVQAGQNVQVRYQAYPYQKFGQYPGTVASVSRSTVAPGELPPQFAGLAGAAAEPLYRITVQLAKQTVTAYGRAMPLQPGMHLEADIALERRRLIEWVFDPLYTLTGKWQR